MMAGPFPFGPLVRQALVTAAAAVLLTGCLGVRRNAEVTAGYGTLICHRGESFDAPENTLPDYRMAVKRGFGFECDVYLSKDGRVSLSTTAT